MTKKEEKAVRWAYKLTIAYFVAVLLIAFANWLVGPHARVNLNELGDFFAGAMSPLAVFWLVMVYLQQRKEMREQVRQTQEIAVATRKQVEIIDEQFHKLHEPLFVFVEDQSKADGSEVQFKVLAKNIGGVAKNLWGVGPKDTKIIFQDFETAIQGQTGLKLRIRFKDTVFIEKGCQFTISFTLELLNDDEKNKPYPFEIHYEDSLGRVFIQNCKYAYTKQQLKPDLFFVGRAQLQNTRSNL